MVTDRRPDADNAEPSPPTVHGGVAATPTRRPGLREAGAAFKIPEFRRFWAGALVSNSGSWMQNVSVPFALYQLTESATWVGIASFAQFFPALVFGPLGGSLADRFSRRTVLIVAQAGMAAVALALWALWATGVAEAWSITALVAAFGAIAGINIGSWQAFVSELVPRELLLNAVTLNSAQFNGARAFGPAVGGFVLATLGPSGAFALNALSFVAVIGALSTIRPRPAALGPGDDRPSVLGETRETIAYIGTMPGIGACVVVVAALGFFGNPVFPLLAVFAEEVFSVTGALYGLLGAALGIGGVLATPIVAGRGSGVRRSRLAAVALATYGVSLIVFALSPVFPMAVVALVVAGGGYLAVASTLNTTIQMQVAEERRGKVLALYVMGLTSSYPLGSLVQGAVADLIGVQAVTALAGLGLLVVWTWIRATGRFRMMDGEEPVSA
ncbi:MAG: MFS transporter [Acidimicrobiales bacterium]|nr:MFS transporter [Acidimicrobiales bacterium]